MNEIDTVLFDKTGTLTRERPEVGRVIASPGFRPEQILQFAAAAEKKFHHPIALAILDKARELGLELPATDDTKYKVGYGITVTVEAHTVRVGSKRFMELEGVTLTAGVMEGVKQAHRRDTPSSWCPSTVGLAERSNFMLLGRGSGNRPRTS